MSEALFDAGFALRAISGAACKGGRGLSASSVCVDSRKTSPGGLFVALPGERADGHRFVMDAFGRGASLAMVRKDRAASLGALPEGKGLILVDDCLAALQALAASWLDRFPGLVRIGVTGSSGKTTAKELLASILSFVGPTYRNEGNLNSDSGLPLAAFGVGPGHRFGVFEMGMNRKGEMAELAAVLRPRYVLYTNIGSAHIGILGSREAIALEKKQATSRFHDGCEAYIHEDEAFLPLLSEGLKGRLVTYGPRTTKGFGGAESRGLDGSVVHWEGLRASFPLPGAHNVRNAIGAAALARRLGAGAADVVAGLEAAGASFGRSELLKGRATVLADCYNANPESMLAAIELCDETPWAGRKVYVLGDMRELGAESLAAHQAAIARARASKADLVILFGEAMAEALGNGGMGDDGGRVLMARDRGELARLVGETAREGDLFLFKASRGLALEEFIPLALGRPIDG
jgi:UDP-N-acetylmuramoyl-tripeptide--D-alanyl-D-alanine ligase